VANEKTNADNGDLNEKRNQQPRPPQEHKDNDGRKDKEYDRIAVDSAEQEKYQREYGITHENDRNPCTKSIEFEAIANKGKNGDHSRHGNSHTDDQRMHTNDKTYDEQKECRAKPHKADDVDIARVQRQIIRIDVTPEEPLQPVCEHVKAPLRRPQQRGYERHFMMRILNQL
jgi:hypothetical protein